MLKLEKRQYDSRRMALLSPLIAILLTLITGALLFSLLGHDPFNALYTFFLAPLSDLYGWTELGVKVTPLLLCATGLNMCYQAKIWNIGAEGQFIIGALAGGWVGLSFPDVETYWMLALVLVFGVLGGMLWAGLAAWLRTHFNANEILTTIMLNYIALYTLLYAVHGPLKDPAGYNFPESAQFGQYITLPPLIGDYRMNISVLFALLALVICWTLLSRTLLGFQIKVLGEDRAATAFAGFSEKRITWWVMLISGGLAGLAGISEVAGPIGQLVPQISPGYGYTAIIVVFLGRMSPIGILFASILLGMTYMGGEMIQMDLNLPKSITGLFQGMLLFFLLASDFLISYRIIPANKLSWART